MRRCLFPFRVPTRRLVLLVVAVTAVAGSLVSPVGATEPDDLVPAGTLAVVATEMHGALARPVASDELVLGRKALRNDSASDAAVRTYLLQAGAANVLAAHAVELIGEQRFAGVALDTPGQRIRLFLAGDDFDAVSRLLMSSLPAVVPTKVDLPLVQLLGLHRLVADQMERFDGFGVRIVKVGEDIRLNKVVVGVASDVAQAQQALRQAFPEHADRLVVEQGPNLRPLGVTQCESRDVCPGSTTTTGTTSLITGPTDAVLRGGLHVRTEFPRGIWPFQVTDSYNCTSAFAARRISDNAVMLLTAGHCFDEGDTVKHADLNIGKASIVRFGGAGRVDALAIKLEDTSSIRWLPNHWIYAGSNKEHQIRSVWSRTGGWAVVGEPVAKEGITTNQTVGQILMTGLTMRCLGCGDDGADVTLENQTEASACGERGDSGGPAYWLSAGYGILSLADLDIYGRCQPEPRTYFNILSDVEDALGVRVYELR